MPSAARREYAPGMNAARLRWLLLVLDLIGAVVLAAMWLVDAGDGADRSATEDVGVYALALGASLPFAVRRLAPRPVFVVMATCFAAALVFDVAGTGVGVAFAAYTVMVERPRREGLATIAIGYALIVAAYLLLSGTTLSTFFLDAVTFGGVIALAELVRTRRAYTEIYELRAAQLERERLTLAQDAVNAERLRIARELHDVVAHAISLIAVQSSVGLDRLRAEPDVTAQALGTIETSSRDALAEMRRMSAVLRSDDESLAHLAPSPGLDQIAALAAEASAAGVGTRVVVDGVRPAACRLASTSAAYRIVQEALTNVVKHASGSSAVVTVAWYDRRGPRRGDRQRARARSPRTGIQGGSGHGLLGMRERVALLRRNSRRGASGRRWLRRSRRASVRGDVGMTAIVRRAQCRPSRRSDDLRDGGRRRGAAAAGLAALVRSTDDIEVVGEASNGAEAVRLDRRDRPTSYSWTSACPRWTASRRPVGSSATGVERPGC